MKQKYLEMLQQVWEAAQLFIEKSIAENETINFKNEAEDQGEYDTDFLYILPYVWTVGKYGNYDEWAVVSVERKGEDIILHTIGKGENSEDADFTLPELDNANMCFLADEIEKIKNLATA